MRLQQLQRNGPLQRHILRQIDDSHATPAKFPLEGVTASQYRLDPDEFAGGVVTHRRCVKPYQAVFDRDFFFACFRDRCMYRRRTAFMRLW